MRIIEAYLARDLRTNVDGTTGLNRVSHVTLPHATDGVPRLVTLRMIVSVEIAADEAPARPHLQFMMSDPAGARMGSVFNRVTEDAPAGILNRLITLADVPLLIVGSYTLRVLLRDSRLPDGPLKDEFTLSFEVVDLFAQP